MICAITVTFNSSHLLYSTILALQSQNSKADKIIIVDNGSDNEHQQKIEEIVKKYSNTEILKLHDNYGGAGGFYYGMKYAKKKYSPDWYWIMDDDACPKEDCLKILLKEAGKKESGVGCIVPLVYGVDLKKYQLYHNKRVSKVTLKMSTVCKRYKLLKERTELDACAFVGPLISKEAVEHIGFPRKELFIYGDDTEYTYRISRILKVILVKRAVIFHRDPIFKKDDESYKGWWKEYYMYRNKLFMIREYQSNLLFRMIAVCGIFWTMFKSIAEMLIRKKYKGCRKFIAVRIKLYSKAIIDGIRGKAGKTVDPSQYAKEYA